MKLSPENEQENKEIDGITPKRRLFHDCICYKKIDTFYKRKTSHDRFCTECFEIKPEELRGIFEEIKTWHSLTGHEKNNERSVNIYYCSVFQPQFVNHAQRIF